MARFREATGRFCSVPVGFSYGQNVGFGGNQPADLLSTPPAARCCMLPPMVAVPHNVYIVSDATGETAEKAVRAALLQFTVPVQLRMFTRVRSEEEVRAIVDRARESNALVVYTMANAEFRERLRQLCEEKQLEAVDLIGALMAKLTVFLGAQPIGVPGAQHTVSEEYYRRIEAVEFTVKNDDGREPRNLPKADLVLVGVSRTSKTPLSTFLSQKGIKVANVPLVLGIQPPVELGQVHQHKVFGLTIQLDTLVQVRQARLKHLGMPADTSYGLRDHVREELGFAQEVFRQHPDWPVIDVTNKAIEETAADILRIKKDRERARLAAEAG
jgi:regulator of PEP synthase PpsR (kinase-PPPase family)